MHNTLVEALAGKSIKLYEPEELEVGIKVGKGSFGDVFKGEIKETKEVVAIKAIEEIPDDTDDKAKLTELLNELTAMMKVETFCNKTPKFYGLYRMKKTNISCIAILFSFIEGNTLDKYLEENKNNKELTKLKKLNICIELVEIIIILHKNKVYHRDIKPGNVMVKPDGSLILLDFGVSKISDNTLGSSTNKVRGTPKYSPPEAFTDVGDENIQYNVSPKFDVWSLGCVILEIFSNIPPWAKKYKDDNKIILSLIKKQKYGLYDFPFPAGFEEDYPEIFPTVVKCLISDIENRLTSEQLIKELLLIKKDYEDSGES